MNGDTYIRIAGIIKRCTGINDFSLFRKRCAKRVGKLIYHKHYSASDIVRVMEEMGMRRGSLVCVHASMMQFYNYDGTAQELIDGIMESIGPEGTLMMPAFPAHIDGYDYSEPFFFDVDNDKTGAGYLAEVFRRMKGVKRSAVAKSSACAIGPLADYLVGEHHLCQDCWDTYSPWYRMCREGGLVFNLGMPRSYIGTFHHCVESTLKNEHPYWKQFFNRKGYYNYVSGGQRGEYVNTDSDLVRKTRESQVTRYFTEEEWSIRKLSNLEIKLFNSRKALDKMIELGRKGVSVYRIPSAANYNKA